MKRVKVGKNAWRCVIDPKPEQPTVSDLKISCAGGAVRNGACTCARTHKPVKAGKNAWRCVAVDAPKDKGSTNKFDVKTAPKKPLQPGISDRSKGSKDNGRTAKKGSAPSAIS
jgi:hypothetical protein